VTVTAVVLAAGAARRLGRPKQLEQVGGLPLVARALAAGTPADERLVLLGSSAVLIRPTVERYAPTAKVSVVEDWQRGIGHVLACGVSRLPADTEAIVVLLADQPFVTADAVSALIASWQETGETWLCAGYAPRRRRGTGSHRCCPAARRRGSGRRPRHRRRGRPRRRHHRARLIATSATKRTSPASGRHPADVRGSRVYGSATDSNPRETWVA
jgi:CTP:molybdopterin cytidylyltransferase MocA